MNYEAEDKSQMQSHYTLGMPPNPDIPYMPIEFQFFRFRFHFRALDPVHFPYGKSANVVRGAFGNVLHEAVPASVYGRLFEPGAQLAASPSGLADWPRPFVLRAAHLDGITIPPDGPFYLDAHVFDLREPALQHFRSALILIADKGLGPGRGRAELERIDQLSLEDQSRALGDLPSSPSTILLDPEQAAPGTVRVRFQTPTELKSGGEIAAKPDFATLFGRLRDRISTLRALYGPGPLPVDFQGLGERAKAIRLVRSELTWQRVQRRSGRTGQVHSIGGFTGDAEYSGDLCEFLPWLRAARWVGVGRQTVWGKGDVRVIDPIEPTGDLV